MINFKKNFRNATSFAVQWSNESYEKKTYIFVQGTL